MAGLHDILGEFSPWLTPAPIGETWERAAEALLRVPRNAASAIAPFMKGRTYALQANTPSISFEAHCPLLQPQWTTY
jgi:hypothetical protein